MNVAPLGVVRWASWPAAPAPATYDIREAVIARSRASAWITSIVGNRIRPGTARPQTDALPALSIKVISNPRGHWLGGPNGMADARIQFDCWALSKAEATRLKRAVERVWDVGRVGTVLGIEIVRSHQIDEVDLDEDLDDGTDRRVYHTAADYRIKHRVSITGPA